MDIGKEEKLSQLDKVLNCHALQGSETLRAFLRFIGMKAINGQENYLKEYVIATELFGRASDFDSRIDSVVRVQAGRLRTKLLEYYATDGKNDEVLIDLPKGHYIPVFIRAHVSAAEGASEAERENTERRTSMPLWSDLLHLPDPVLVVFSNTIFHGTYEDGMKLFNSLDVVESNGDSQALAWGVSGNEKGNQPLIDHYTGIGEVMGVHFLGDFFTVMRHPYRVKRSLMLTWDDAKAENIVVLGSPAENLFLLDLPQKQDFVFRWMTDDQQRHVNAIVNTDPQPGEQEYYFAKQFGHSPSQISEDFAVVSLLQGLSEKNRLMILAGINTFGTQAAAEYVTQPEYIKSLISHLNLAPENQPPVLPAFYQVLLKVKVNGGVPVQISYVTHHVLNQ